ncbi:cytochrome d ubiquinol oxidase subunit II [Parapedobacter koreensis]|uniref:Cytochrome bd-I ubiquinol oxidase subunit 2 apoprotein n=1 Tax=Parapedobacter koreensis TaxID=332977 RepID=A0A1H7TT91_9SPHI|nr:cytochrome d ubiquinol oxidase subunit II [Parapedobacter koreensis]SEL87676.1 cytochrome bd-I ubiquinol oxidase subunit 2 apoprotein [Parapedobacter koreensis]
MLYVVIIFLWASICLYLLLGGADFGAGIVELTVRRKHNLRVRSIMSHAIGPIWEANHMWLIIAIVILFVGFPEIYTTMSIYMHIPLVAMLLGIMARGTAFVFRSYDAVADEWQRVYTYIYTWSSVITPFFLGMIAAATVARTIDVGATDFVSAYIGSWVSWFGVAIGFFTTSICGYLAATYAIGAVENEYDRTLMIRSAKRFIYLVVGAGALVFLSATYSDIPLMDWIFGARIGQAAILLATISLGLTFLAFKRRKAVAARVLAGFQVTMILLAATYQHYPELVLFKHGGGLSLIEHADNAKTIAALAWALLLGSPLILPFLFYLMRVFGKRSPYP